jgi:hypothetical protein
VTQPAYRIPADYGQQPVTPPPAERPSVPQAEAVAEAQEAEVSAVLPALTAFVAAVLAYVRAGGRIAGLPLTVAAKVGYDAAVIGILTAIASRALDHTRAWSGSRAAEELWLGQDVGIRAGVESGLTTLAQAAKHIGRSARLDEAAGGSPGVSLPGEIYDPTADEVTRSYADPGQIALPVVQSTRHAAQLAAAEEAGWTRKTWVDMHDNRVRVNHAFLGSKSYEFHTVPIMEPFVTLDDNKLWFPGDTSAPPHEWMRCRCWLKLSR